MNSHEREIRLLRSFHYSAELPVLLTEGGRRVYSLPERIVTAAGLTGQDALLPQPIPGEGHVQYLETPVSECYICLRLPAETEILVGPFLTGAPSAVAAAELVRKGSIELRHKSAVQEHLIALPVLSEQRYFYTGSLLEELFEAEPVQSESYDDAELSSRFLRPEIYRQTQDYRLRQFLHSPYMTEQEICRAIGSGDREAAFHVLREINRRPRARLAGTALRSLKNSLICSCTFMARAAISGGVNPDEAFTMSDAYIQRIETASDPQELMDFEERMVAGYTDAVNARKGSRYSSYVTQALRYIDTHLCEPLDTAAVAQAVYLSPNYLSSLFLKETGETVHNAILRRRIEEASFFVASTKDSFADIASFYQFCSQSHFVQCFKRIKGVTPGVYRKNGGV